MADLSSIEARQVACGDLRLSYLESGAGRPLVLLHGIGSAARSWRRQLETLSDRYRVIAWNAPGYGESSPLAPQAPDAGDYASALHGLLEALAIDQCDLVGHSLGSLMAARFAAEWPGRLRSLTLASTALGHRRLPAADRARQLQSRLDDMSALGPRAMAEKRAPRLLGPDANAGLLVQVTETMAMLRPDGYAQAARMLAEGDLLEDIARLPAGLPLQVIVGAEDIVTPPEANRRAAAIRPGTPFHLVPGAGHAVYLEKPEKFNSLLATFLETRHG